MNQGVTYEKAKDEKDKDDQVKDIDLFMGVFFDGTGNNEDNIDSYQEYKSSSWLGKVFKSPKLLKYHVTCGSSLRGYSNVARLHKVFKKEESNKSKLATSVYVQGIGTTTVIDMVPTGQAFGVGITGVNAKVKDGCKGVVKEINHIVKKVIKKPCKITLHLSVLGFSRGAAAARRFVTCIDSTSGDKVMFINECLSEHLEDKFKKKGLVRDVKVKVDFLGLFDTVSSYGVVKTFKSESDNVKELGLSLSGSKASNVVQICAGDEYRDHFSLTTTGTGVEYIIPGAHADVGGGYNDWEYEEWKETKKVDVAKGISVPLKNGYKTKQELLDGGWYTQRDIDQGGREVRSDYSLIPFSFMLEHLKKYNSYSVVDASELSKKKYETVPSDLSTIKGMIMAKKSLYDFKGSGSNRHISDFKEDVGVIAGVRHKYLHLSAEPGLSNGPAKNNTRVIVDGK